MSVPWKNLYFMMPLMILSPSRNIVIANSKLQAYSKETPIQTSILTENQTFHVEEGQNLVLPCQIDDQGAGIVAWFKGGEVLTLGLRKLTRSPYIKLNSSYSMENNTDFSINIKNITKESGGEYICKILQEFPVEIKHRVVTTYRPVARISPKSNVLQFTQDTIINCIVDGNPFPNVTWYFTEFGCTRTKKILMLLSVKREIEIAGSHKSEAGVYVCAATNRLGTSNATVRIDAQLHPSPDQLILAKIGDTVQLSCPFRIYPLKNLAIAWFFLQTGDEYHLQSWRNDRITRKKIQNDSRHEIVHEIQDNIVVTYLTIRNVEAGDFSTYKCVISGDAGRNEYAVTMYLKS